MDIQIGCEMMAKLESKFQAELKKELRERYPGCVVTKNDPSDIQGFPDLTVLHGRLWAELECKRETKASKRPNQEYYVNKLNNIGFSAFIFPENKAEVLAELDKYFEEFGGETK